MLHNSIFIKNVTPSGTLLDDLRDLVPFVQLKKREKDPCET